MAKKNASENPFSFGKNAVEKRRAIHSPESLREQLNQLRSACDDFETYLEVIDSEEITKIQVDGAAKFENGMNLINTYLVRVRMGIARTALPGAKRKEDGEV